MATNPGHDNRRSHDRARRHMGCEIRLGEKSYTGVVTNLTAQGMFVRTNLEAEPERRVGVVIRRPGGDVWLIEARVARQAERAPGSVIRRGIGLEILEAPEGFHAFVAELAGEG